MLDKLIVYTKEIMQKLYYQYYLTDIPDIKIINQNHVSFLCNMLKENIYFIFVFESLDLKHTHA